MVKLFSIYVYIGIDVVKRVRPQTSIICVWTSVDKERLVLNVVTSWRHAAGFVLSPPLREDLSTPDYLMQMLACGELQCKHRQSREGSLTGRAVCTVKLLLLSFLIGVKEIPELRITWKEDLYC